MSNLSAFMHANVEQIENYKFAASPRFKGEDGKPMLWEELLGKLLIGGEFDDYVTEVFQLNGFKAENELVDEAKN